MWKEIIGKSPSRQLLLDTINLYASNETYLTYSECEAALLQEIQDNGTIDVLTLEYTLISYFPYLEHFDEFISYSELSLFKSDEEIAELTPFQLRNRNDDEDRNSNDYDDDDNDNDDDNDDTRGNRSLDNQERQLERQESKIQQQEPQSQPQSQPRQQSREIADINSQISPSSQLLSKNTSKYNEMHPQSNLFSLIDRNSDGKLTLTEFIQALRTQPSVSKVSFNYL